MGRGNVCVNEPHEGLWYVDWDMLSVYRNVKTDEYIHGREIDLSDMDDCEFCQSETDDEYWAFIELFRSKMRERFKSFDEVNRWVSDCGCRCDRKAILENRLFFIAVEDNEWSVAVELIQKRPEELSGIQVVHSQRYLEAMKEILLDMFGEVGYRTGAWTSGVIKAETKM